MKSIDLFSGAGGLSCGLQQAGFHPILSNELVPQYAETYQQNYPNAHMIVGDVRTICESRLKQYFGVSEGEVDLVAGGPPCQGFSINAPIRSLDDARNHLFKDFLRIVSAIQPKAVLIENVPGIISLGRGTVVDQIHKELQAMGYKVAHRILFAGHYGVPQMRFRTVFIGIKNFTGEISFPEPEYDAKAIANFTGAKELCLPTSPLFAQDLKRHITVWDAMSDLPEIDNGNTASPQEYATKPGNAYQKYLRSDGQKLTAHYCAKVAKVNLERLKYIPQGGSWRDIPFDLLPAGLQRARRSDHTKRYGRLHPDALCSTVLTKCDPHWGSFFHPTQDRIISVREAARIQSFPDDYQFSGSVTQQYEQIGNAVPPLLGRAIGNEIARLLGEK
ncbi:MAG: DNA cytosine methyltransferase [Candidatus Accumulibacter sp.]|jgi:DNA (cytosine-5)-methyltransferase 1|nr:DNA cytosine methyltransferase [Accumulibacter sp.]